MKRHSPTMRQLVVCAAVCISGIAVPARSVEQRVACPLAVEPDAFVANRPPAGWTALNRGARLSTGGLLHGAPEESAYLKPTMSKNRKTGPLTSIDVNRWTLSMPHSYETWLYCEYGTQQLFKRVMADATECTLTTQVKSGTVEAMVFLCK